MPKVTYVTPSGEFKADAFAGQSVMDVAIQHGVPGINGDCGGSFACATCSVRLDDAWISRAGGPCEMELALLEYSAAADLGGTGRLSCQIKLRQDLDGLIVHVPESQV